MIESSNHPGTGKALLIGTEVRINSNSTVGEGMRGVIVPPRYRLEPGHYVLVIIGMPLGLMEFHHSEFDVIERGES